MNNSKTFLGNLRNIFDELARHTFSDAAKLESMSDKITSNQLNFWETGGSANQISAEISGFSFNIPVIISLRLTDEGATTPKLVSG